MSAGIPRPPGPSITWWIFAPTVGAPCAEISLTWVRHVGSLAGLVKKANTSSAGRLITTVRWAFGIGCSSGWHAEAVLRRSSSQVGSRVTTRTSVGSPQALDLGAPLLASDAPLHGRAGRPGGATDPRGWGNRCRDLQREAPLR